MIEALAALLVLQRVGATLAFALHLPIRGPVIGVVITRCVGFPIGLAAHGVKA